jgi:hypothetical protein
VLTIMQSWAGEGDEELPESIQKGRLLHEKVSYMRIIILGMPMPPSPTQNTIFLGRAYACDVRFRFLGGGNIYPSKITRSTIFCVS